MTLTPNYCYVFYTKLFRLFSILRIIYVSFVSMKMNILCCLTFIILSPSICTSQFIFSGNVENDSINGTAYLSIIEDYRKISGVYEEQIISMVKVTNNFFEFKGNNLDTENKIYRIHIDNCNELDTNHFNGKCDTSREIIFIAKNNDSISLPISLDNQMFCAIESTNKQSNTIFQIELLKEEMRYDYGNYRSKANRKLNNKKWFVKLQQYGEQQDEPLAELYIYNFLSDRTNDLYSYYLEDLNSNNYYDKLSERLAEKYPNTNYLEQYKNEIAADKFRFSTNKTAVFNWRYVVYPLLGLSVLLNFIFWFRFKKDKKNGKTDLKNRLTEQEQKILSLILQNKTNKEIATEVFISLSTVKTHINNLYKKLNIDSREQLKTLFNG